ncbi:transcriptional regulator [Amycolatopsis halotolerans]|uniref:Transcriptional regulator n=2 Tax=Amycolatopsis halotolerans TaxID=330083 RepID=A0ABV7QI29_9PSEU|nr:MULTISPECIES: transcriptional regulator [unclassified Amycolatopsis]
MSEDWAAVARAINQRMADLGLSQRELIARSQVSKATVREIQHNRAQRRRSERTLEALSLALELHAGHLAAVLAGRRPPEPGEPAPRGDDDIPGRLAVIEHQLREITDRLREMNGVTERLDEIQKSVSTVVDHVSVVREQRRR